jgi:hypothetical protein
MGDRIIFWSGGYDSTLLVHQEVLKYIEEGPIKRSDVLQGAVKTWTLDWSLIEPKKTKSEELCRKSFIDYAREVYKVEIDNRVIQCNNFPDPGGSGVLQASWFIPLCTYLAPSESTIVFGFHAGDDFWQHWGPLDYVRHYLAEAMEKKVTFEFPLKTFRKWWIVKEIRSAGLERFCWTCEDPKEIMQPCGKCIPCVNMKLTDYEIGLRKEEPIIEGTSSCVIDKVLDKIKETSNGK